MISVKTWHLLGFVDQALTGKGGCELSETEGFFPVGKGNPEGMELPQ
jgi:hypothetical protein